MITHHIEILFQDGSCGYVATFDGLDAEITSHRDFALEYPDETEANQDAYILENRGYNAHVCRSEGTQR